MANSFSANLCVFSANLRVTVTQSYAENTQRFAEFFEIFILRQFLSEAISSKVNRRCAKPLVVGSVCYLSREKVSCFVIHTYSKTDFMDCSSVRSSDNLKTKVNSYSPASIVVAVSTQGNLI